MPINVRLDLARRIRFTTASGVVTESDVIDGYGSVLTDPGYDPTLDQLFDGTGIQRVDVTAAVIKKAADLFAKADSGLPPGVRPRVAIVAPTDATFGLARMYQAYREVGDSPKQYLTCRTLEGGCLHAKQPYGRPCFPVFVK